MSLVVSTIPRFCFFFFQAEDGIRDYKVTGVQTCALPICLFADCPEPVFSAYPYWSRIVRHAPPFGLELDLTSWKSLMALNRSEERRVGKECRYRRWRMADIAKQIQTTVY